MMRAARSCAFAAFVAAIGMAACAPCRSQSMDTYGLIVSVRGDIYQIEQPYLKGVSRFLVTKQTTIVDREPSTVDVLRPGMRIVAEGRRTDSGKIALVRILAASDPSALALRGAQVGVLAAPDRAGWFDVGGTLRSLSPPTLFDDSGSAIPITLPPHAHVQLWTVSGKSAMLIGERAFVHAERREGDIMLASEIVLRETPGEPGTVFGSIVRKAGAVLTVMPRFATQSMELRLAHDPVVERQIAVNPSSIHVGQTVTVWGGHSADKAPLSQITAYVLMPGRESFPASGTVAADDPSPAGRNITGTVVSLGPLRLRTRSGAILTVTVPGETPTARYEHSSAASLRAGASCMIVCRKTPAGLVARRIILDASPVIALGL